MTRLLRRILRPCRNYVLAADREAAEHIVKASSHAATSRCEEEVRPDDVFRACTAQIGNRFPTPHEHDTVIQVT